MINQFRTLNPVNLLLLVLYAVLLRLPIFVNLPPSLSFAFLEPYAKLFLHLPKTDVLSPATNVFLATVIIVVQALLFNVVVNAHNLLPKPSYLPALMYITGSSLFMFFLVLSPPLICNFLIIWMMHKLLLLAKTENAMMAMYDTGMIVALGTLMYFPFVVLLGIAWLALLLYRSFSWREWLSVILGFLTIFVFVAVYYYWNDSLHLFYNIWRPLGNKFPTVFTINYNDYLVLLPLLVIMVLAVVQLRENFFRSFIATRKAFQLLFFMFLLGILSCYAKFNFRLHHFLLAVPPGAVLLAYYFANAKKRWFYETLFGMLFLSIVYFLIA